MRINEFNDWEESKVCRNRWSKIELCITVVFRIMPEERLTAPDITFANVDFPEPDGPIDEEDTISQ